jgi:hypothetical protein
MRRLAALGALLAALAGACGGTETSGGPAPPTPEQLAARQRLLDEIAAGTYDCGCTSEARALERMARGQAKDRPASAASNR